ncbi:MAG: Flp pilus assembly complex ATPase component TadA [Myxococcales bacterium]|nr:MAG: Flp pilus assembly complex ATPase component TadA [Myxococcales bacterium]
MITVILAEKGGSERQIEFDKPEITIGRIKGNDIVLPKGNVSKRHSRIVFKDGRFIVVDLKSTNGTYVNGRKITSPVVVKNDDKVYIGDFIISLKANEAEKVRPSTPSIPVPDDEHSSAVTSNSTAAKVLSDAPAPVEQSPYAKSGRPTGSLPPALPPKAPSSVPQNKNEDEVFVPRPSTAPRSPGGLERKARPSALPWSKITLDLDHQKAKDLNSALRLLMRHISRVFDVENPDPDAIGSNSRRHAAEKHIESTLHELQNQGLIDTEVDGQALAKAAYQEAVGLGPLETLMADTQIQEILIMGPKKAFADFGKGLKELESINFSSSNAVITAAHRLMGQAGLSCKVNLPIQQGRLADGSQVTIWQRAVAPQGPMIRIKRAQEGTVAAKTLIEAGVLSEEILELIEEAMARRVGILVSGPPHSGVSKLLSALANSIPQEEWLLSIESDVGLSLAHPKHISLNRGDAEGQAETATILARASQFRYEWLIVDDIIGAEAFDLIEHMVSGSAGTLLGFHASGVQDPLLTLCTMAKFHVRAPANMANLIADAIGLTIEMDVDEEGKPFVVTVREPTGTRGENIKTQDLFVVEEGEFVATGKEAKFLS